MIVNAAPTHHRQAGARSVALEQSILLPAWGVHVCLENTVIFFLLPATFFASLVLLHLLFLQPEHLFSREMLLGHPL